MRFIPLITAACLVLSLGQASADDRVPAAASPMDSAMGSIKDKAVAIKDTASDKAGVLKDNAADKAVALKEKASDKMVALKDATSDKAAAVKDKVSDKTAAKAAPLDINSASAAELDAIPGLGEKRVAAIIAGRPYKGKDDLVAKKIIPKGVYDKIKDQIIAKQK